MDNNRGLKWFVFGLIFLIFVSLIGWYVYLKRNTGAIDAVTAGRGLNNSDVFGSPLAPLAAQGEETAPGATTTTETTYLISEAPTGMATFVGSGTVARFVDERNGNVFDINLANGKATRVTNTLIPRLGDAVWIGDSRVIIRSLDEEGHIVTTISTIEASASSSIGSLKGIPLEPDILAVAVAPDQLSFVRLSPNESGSRLIRANPDGSQPKTIWSSELQGWRLSWPVQKTILLQSRAAAGVAGSLYALNPDTGDVRPLLVNIAGLTSLYNPKTHDLLYSESYTRRPRLFYQSASSTKATPLPYTTLAEKCVWSLKDAKTVFCAIPRRIPEGVLYPDDWYRGEFHSDDVWMTINLATGISTVLSDPQTDFGESLDVDNPSIDPSGERIVFTDASTGKPWIVKIQ